MVFESTGGRGGGIMTFDEAQNDVAKINEKWAGMERTRELRLDARRLNREEKKLHFSVMAHGNSRWNLVVGELRAG